MMEQAADLSDFSDEVSTFGDRIVAARESLGMTSEELARRLGIKRQTLQNWEEDRSEPRANKLQMLAGVLNVSIIWLMSGHGTGVTTETGDGMAAGDANSILKELRDIRQAQTNLSERMRRLERRIIAGQE